MDYRIEKDTIGEVKVPSDKYWGAQTERSRNTNDFYQSQGDREPSLEFKRFGAWLRGGQYGCKSDKLLKR